MEKIDVIVRASGLHDEKTTAALKSRLLGEISAAGDFTLEEVALPAAERFAAILVLTGGVEREVLKVVAQLPSPTLLIAHPGNNSLPASLEILARIRQDGGEGRILFGSPEEIARGLRQEVALANAWEQLRFSRIGLIGEPSDWLVASDVDRAFLKGRLSIELIQVGIEDLLSRVETATASRRDVSSFKKAATETREADSGDLRGAVEIYGALRGIVDEHRLSACTVRCFDLLDRVQNTGCYALSRLNDERIPAGCEGDLQTLFSLYVAFLLSGETAFMGNIASVDLVDRVVGIAHCTCPLSMTNGYAIRSHFESGIGVGIAGQLPVGPCTLFRLGGERLDQLFVREGAIVETTTREDLCRTQVRIHMNDPIDELLSSPLGNHHVLVSGHLRSTIERFFDRHLRS